MKFFLFHILIAIGLLATTINVVAQNNTVSGRILDENGEPMPGAIVLNIETKKGIVSDFEGAFEINIPESKCNLEISSIGYEKQSFLIDFSTNPNKKLGTIVLKEDVEVMSEVVITANEVESIKQKAFAVTAIDAKPLQIRNLDVNQVLNRVTGVRIRESGGMGSKFNFSLNGLSGNQVKLFVNDIPMEVMGRAYGLNNLPVNLIDRVDVYKGVVPIDLGSDALGGAVNVLTDNTIQKYLDVSYSFGSFNTHRASVVNKYRFDNGLTVGLKGFYNYSDNNYRMFDVEAYDDKGKPYKADLDRFHDNYESKMIQTEIGFTDKNWADVLMISAAYADLTNKLQTGFSVNPPYGEANEAEEDYILNLDYRKADFIIDDLDIKLYSLYSEFDRTIIDTSSYIYNWEAERKANINPTWGEALREKSFFEFRQTSFLQRAFLSYDLTFNQKLSFNYITTHIERQGENRYLVDDQQAFKNPNSLSKHIFGLSHEINLFNQNLSIISAIKYYYFDIKANNVLTYIDNSFEIETLHTKLNEPGYALAIRHYFKENFYMKASFEKGYRIPEPVELFGDGLSIQANPLLKPEQSYNINLGGQYSYTSNDNHSLQLGVNGFYRDVRDFILEKNNGKVNQYENVLDVLSKGIETEFKYRYKTKLNISGNITWQEFINNEEISKTTGRANPAYGLRIPNRPFLFGNFDVSYTFKPIANKIGISSYYSFNYVNAFLLNYQILKGAQNEIPSQLVQNIGLTLIGPQQRHSLSLECRNILNALAYDNYKLQRPGRAFYVKWRYFLK